MCDYISFYTLSAYNSVMTRRTNSQKVSRYELEKSSALVYTSPKKAQEWYKENGYWTDGNDMVFTQAELIGMLGGFVKDCEKSKHKFAITLYTSDSEDFWHRITNVDEDGQMGKAYKYINLYDSGVEEEEEEEYDDLEECDDDEDELESGIGETLREDILEYLEDRRADLTRLNKAVEKAFDDNKTVVTANDLLFVDKIHKELCQVTDLICELTD